MKGYSTSKLVPTNNVTHLVSFAAVFRLVTQRWWEERCVTSPKTAAKETMAHSPLLKKRRKLDRVNFCKGFWCCYQGHGEKLTNS